MERRVILVFIFFLILYLAVLVRLFHWQIVSFENLKGLADKQTKNQSVIKANRGKILTSDDSLLVINQPVFLVSAAPKVIDNPENYAKILSRELDEPYSTISAKLAKSDLYWVALKEGVSEQTVENLKKYSLSGINFEKQSKRYYPEASMAAHLLGFVGKNTKGESQGYFGIEGYYDEQIRGRDGIIFQEEDPQGNPILLGKIEDISAEDGRDLTLTVDKTVQYIVETKLTEGIAKYGASGGTVIVIDPLDGAVLAMSSFPAYDPGDYSSYSPDLYKNPSITSAYEPGSTFKVLIMAAAMNEGKITPSEKYNETGAIEIGGYQIKTWNQKYHGEISMTQILEYSSNVGMVFVGKQLTGEKLLSYLEKYGFGETTGIDLQEEFTPQVRPEDKWYEIDYATATFGQGIAITPIQMIRAVAAIANGGKLVRPYLVKKIRLNDSRYVNIKPRIEREVMTKRTASILTGMMVSAVDNGETKVIKPKGYRVAGKTGTAQISIAGHYDTEKTIASFIGFAPVDNPKFIMLVTIREPTSSPWGSETAAPLFFSIAKQLFLYFRISPS